MTSDRGSASLTSFAPGGESNPTYVMFDSDSTSTTSKEICVVDEPVRVQAFNIVGDDYITVMQVVHIGDETLVSPYAPWRGPVTLTAERNTLLLDTAGYYQFEFTAAGGLEGTTEPGDFTLIAFPFTMTQESLWSVLGPLIPGLVDQLERVLEGLELNISSEPNNIIVKLPDGLYAEKTFVEGGEGIDVTGDGSFAAPYIVALQNQIESILGADTATVDMVVNQTDPALGPVTVTISANVKISSRADNLLFPDDDGLYASKTYVSRGFGIEVDGSGQPGDPYVISAPCCAKEGEIIGVVCISPSIADPGTPGGLDSAPLRRPDVVLPASGATLNDLSGYLYISLRDIRQNGGSGGPWIVDFSNVYVTGLLYEGLTSRAVDISRIGALQQLINTDQMVSVGFTLIAQAYDLTKNGWASIQVAAGSYLTVTQLSGGVVRKFYIPSGSEGFVGCGDYLYPQGGYSDSWNIFINATAQKPVCTITYAPSTDLLGDIVLGGLNDQLLDVNLNTQLLKPVRLGARVSDFREADNISFNAPYSVNFDNVAMSGFFQQTAGGTVDRTLGTTRIMGPTSGLLAGANSMTFMALEVFPDSTNYDISADGFGGVFVAPGSFVLLMNGDGVVNPVYLPAGSEGVAPQGTYLAPQAAYEDTFYITASGTPPPSVADVTFGLFITPSAVVPSGPVTWPDIGPGDASTTEAQILFGYLEMEAKNILGGRPPYTVDFSNVQINGYIRNNSNAQNVGIIATTYVGGANASSNPVRSNVQATDVTKIHLDPLFNPSHTFSYQNSYGIVFRASGYVIVSDSGIGVAKKQAFHFLPSNKSEGALLVSDTLLLLDPAPGNFYAESYTYAGGLQVGNKINATLCFSPTPNVPLNGVTGYPNVTLPNGTLEWPTSLNVPLRLYLSNISSPDGTLFTASLKNDDSGNPFQVELKNETSPGVLTDRAVSVQRSNSLAISQGNFGGSNSNLWFQGQLVAGVGANKYDVTQNGLASIGLRANSYVELSDGVNTERFYTPGGNDLTVTCNGAPGPYADAFSVTIASTPPIQPITATLGITPSTGLPSGSDTQLTSPVIGPTIPANSGAQAMKAIGVQISNLAGGIGPYTIDFSGVVATPISAIVLNNINPPASLCTNPTDPGAGVIILPSYELCNYDRIEFTSDGMVTISDAQATLPTNVYKWHSLGQVGVPLATQYDIYCSVSGALDNPTDPILGSSPTLEWLGIPYLYPAIPPNQSINPTWVMDFVGAPFSILTFQFRVKGSTNVIATQQIRFNSGGYGTCGVGSPGGGGDGGELCPPRGCFNQNPVVFGPDQFNLLLDGTDSLVTLVSAADIISNVIVGPVTRNYQLAVRSCAVWKDTLAVDLGITLSGFVSISDTTGRSAVLWIPNASEGNVGITSINANPSGGYSDYYRYYGVDYALIRPPIASSPANKFGRLNLLADGTVNGSAIYHDPVNQQLGRWYPSGAITGDYQVRVTYLYGQTESGDTSPTNVWMSISNSVSYSAEDDQQQKPAGFKVEVRNLLGEITTWYFLVVVPSKAYVGPTISYSTIPNPYP